MFDHGLAVESSTTSNMLKLDSIPASEAWQPDPDTISSFSGPYRACRLQGPATLVRLVTTGGRAPEGQRFEANRRDGSFWFTEQDFLRLKAQALADLRGQGDPRRLHDRLGMYLRHQFRDLLAVRRDWTPSFDGYVRLSLSAGESLVALVGAVDGQPVYSPSFSGEASSRQAGIRLAGGLTQFVIDFRFPPNRAHASRIVGPFIF
jgi:hypothetical protein